MSFGYPDAPRPTDPRTLDLARVAVTAPAIFLILNGLLGLFVIGMMSIPLVFDLDMLVEAVNNAVAQQPPGPQKLEMEQKAAELEAAVQNHRQAIAQAFAIRLFVWAVPNLVAIAGGFFMLRLSGYKLAVAGAVLSCVPVATGCLVTGIPIGIWALVVLFRADVKAAFAARRVTPPPDPDAAYLR